ncbi:MAG: hypothetical protein ACXVPU_14885 [Bacteroidia bacterium]
MIEMSVPYKLKIDKQFNENELSKGIFLTIIHATRIPPHIGLIINGKYSSLSVKGQDINTPVNALLKNSTIRKIPSVFVKIKSHTTFSDLYLSEHFITNVQQFPRVDIGIATCLSPIRLFFEEVYNVSMKDVNYLYELLPVLKAEGLTEWTTGLFITENYQLPVYTNTEINRGIEAVRTEFNPKSRQ